MRLLAIVTQNIDSILSSDIDDINTKMKDFLKEDVSSKIIYCDFKILSQSDIVDTFNKFDEIILFNLPSHISIEVYSKIQLFGLSLRVFSYTNKEIYFHKNIIKH